MLGNRSPQERFDQIFLIRIDVSIQVKSRHGLGGRMVQNQNKSMPALRAWTSNTSEIGKRMGNQLILDSCLLGLRCVASVLMIHHGLEKLADPSGFTQFIVDQYFSFLPFDHILWTYLAGYTQVIGSIALLLGVASRPALIGLASTMVFAMVFHGLDSGLEGAPFAVVEAHNYQYETSALYLAIFVVLAVTGSGSLSIASLYRNALPDWAKSWV